MRQTAFVENTTPFAWSFQYADGRRQGAGCDRASKNRVIVVNGSIDQGKMPKRPLIDTKIALGSVLNFRLEYALVIKISMRHIVLLAIRAYQRWISPYKGYCCAYRACTGRASCSVLGFRAVRRFGVLGGWRLIRARTRRCGEVYRRCGAAAPAVRPVPAGQRGFCDCSVPDASCDLPDLPCEPWDGLDVLEGCADCSGGCDRPARPGQRCCGCFRPSYRPDFRSGRGRSRRSRGSAAGG